MDTSELIARAREVRRFSYSPYSHFAVGAAVLACGKVFTGCNVENASYGLTMCAERVAIFNAVSHGCRKIEKIAIFAEEMPYPCGACLQVMEEFCDENCEVIVSTPTNMKKYSLRELLPYPFSKNAL